MATKKRRPGYIEKFLKRADKAVDEAIDQGVKRADALLADAVEFGKITASEAKKKSADLRKQAGIESEKLKSQGERKITKGIATAKKMAAVSSMDLETLAKLGELRKAGIITEKEFQTKKKQILNRI
jgi:polyhydroxyalkanoate synthesis regulator phasin